MGSELALTPYRHKLPSGTDIYPVLIIAHHYNRNQPFLDLLLHSINQQVAINRPHTIVIADSEAPPILPSWVELHYRPDLNLYAKKINAGFREIMPKDATHGMMMNDDILLTSTCLKYLFDACELPGLYALNPASNSDMPHFYAIMDIVDGHPIHNCKGLKVDELDPNEMFNYQTGIRMLSGKHKPACFCTIMSKESFLLVGDLDEKLDSRHNDDDYCIRLDKLGGSAIICFSSFVWHYGGRTIGTSNTMAERDAATDYFEKKHNLKWIGRS